MHLEAVAELSSGQANESDSTAAGMLSVPAWTCPSIENTAPGSALHLSSRSLACLFPGGDTHQLNQEPPTESGPALTVLFAQRHRQSITDRGQGKGVPAVDAPHLGHGRS